MKRKGRTNAAKVEEKPENGVEEANDTNGDHNDDLEDKKKRSAGRNSRGAKRDDEGESDTETSDQLDDDEEKTRKSADKSKDGDGEKSVQSDSDINEKTRKRKSSGKNKMSKIDEDDYEIPSNDDSDSEFEKSPSKKKKSGRLSKNSKVDEDDESDYEVKDKKKRKKSGKGKAKKSKTSEATNKDKDEDEEEQYEVEKVIGEKAIRGVKHYLIRWKGYNSDSDTWEPHNTVDCANLIAQFKKQQKKSKSRPKNKSQSADESWDENADFEVDKILDVHFKKDGKRDFLVSWKGYAATDNTWEPEENMNCTDLIKRFMERVDKAKESTEKELRVNRKHTDRFTLTMGGSGRRLSKRQVGKQRVQYHDAE